MRLREALEASGLTQRQLAEAIGVSDAAVNHWVKGRRPIPQDRLAAVEAVLGSDVGQLVLDYDNLLEEARTPLGYVILWPIKCPLRDAGSFVEPRSAQDFKGRVTLWAQALQVSKLSVEKALIGELLPILAIERMGEIASHVHNPKILARQAGFKDSEDVALFTAIHKARDEAVSFQDAINILVAAREKFQTQELRSNLQKAEEILDNGNPNDNIEWWLRGEDAPEEFQGTREAQDLTGRFRSGT